MTAKRGRSRGTINSLPSKLSRMFRRKENVAKRIGKTKRNVTLDSNVLISYVVSKGDDTVNKKVVTKSITDDRLMISDVIYDECVAYAKRPKARVTEAEIAKTLKELGPIINISPVPSDSDLLKKYRIRDAKDLKILYSVDMTDSVILVTMDDDFTDVEGLKALIMDPPQYLREKGGKKKKPANKRL